ncbi:MAG: hypothetical protein JSW05_13410 [Candidatus Thorarchaeota archaeon]|nr:MAG: hypothetical protein JSW05_13410 [Candidatus Thorarchaeota archaeon]
MSLDFILQPSVWGILMELKWGDRLERDLKEKTPQEDMHFDEIRDRLLELGLVYRFRGGQKSPYLCLTDKGQLLVDRLVQAQDLLDSDDSI